MYWDIKEEGGFIFDNMPRNKTLEKKGVASLKTTKTGTTIVDEILRDNISNDVAITTNTICISLIEMSLAYFIF